MPERARQAAERFYAGTIAVVEALGSGHIHDSFLVEGDGRALVLQRVNTHVFPDASALMSNLERVCAHLAKKLSASGADDCQRRCLEVVPSLDGQGALVRDATGDHWRAFVRVERSRADDVVRNPAHARQAAVTFGDFATALDDLAGAPLHDVIPGFHDLSARAGALEAAVRTDSLARRSGCQDEIEEVLSLYADLDIPPIDALPRRYVHNDCKLNNLLVDETSGEALCVIDLDTVMAGALRDDFGQLVRTASCTAAEDEQDLARIQVDRALVDALCDGYLASVREHSSPEELDALALGPAISALENAIRFLTDHLEGDHYFRLHRAGQNLDRARAQTRLTRELLGCVEQIHRCVGA